MKLHSFIFIQETIIAARLYSSSYNPVAHFMFLKNCVLSPLHGEIWSTASEISVSLMIVCRLVSLALGSR